MEAREWLDAPSSRSIPPPAADIDDAGRPMRPRTAGATAEDRRRRSADGPPRPTDAGKAAGQDATAVAAKDAAPETAGRAGHDRRGRSDLGQGRHPARQGSRSRKDEAGASRRHKAGRPATPRRPRRRDAPGSADARPPRPERRRPRPTSARPGCAATWRCTRTSPPDPDEEGPGQAARAMMSAARRSTSTTRGKGKMHAQGLPPRPDRADPAARPDPLGQGRHRRHDIRARCIRMDQEHDKVWATAPAS